MENFKAQFHKKTFKVLSDVNTFKPVSPFGDQWLVPFNRQAWRQDKVLTVLQRKQLELILQALARKQKIAL